MAPIASTLTILRSLKRVGLAGLLFVACACNNTSISAGGDDTDSLFGPQNQNNNGQPAAAGGEGIDTGAGADSRLFDQESVDGIPKLAEGGDDVGDIEYPFLEFYGKGALTYDGKYYDSWGEVKANMDEENLNLDLVDLRIIVPDHQGKADEETRKEKGMAVYNRVKTDHMLELVKEKGFDNAAYVIFATGAKKPNGKGTFKFSDPLPVFAWPAREAAYEDLREDGSQTWTAKVNGDYTAHVTVSYEGTEGDLVKVKIDCDLPSDQQGELYEVFPISKSSTYYIDPVKRRIFKIRTTDRFYNEKEKRQEQNDLLWKLCRSSRKGESESYSCR